MIKDLLLKKITKDIKNYSINNSINPESDKFNTIICNICFRMVYISFNYIKDYISTHCLYCSKISIYNYNTFFEKIKGNDILLNSPCIKCNKFFDYSNQDNPFYLIEKSKLTFIVICQKCINEDKTKNDLKINDSDKIINFHKLINFDFKIYQNNDLRLSFLQDLNSQIPNIKENIKVNLKIFKQFENKILLIESINNNVPLSLKIKANKILHKINIIIKIVNMIIENYNNYHNLISSFNIISSTSFLNLNLDIFKLKNSNIYTVNESYNIIKKFIESEQLLLINKFQRPPIKIPNYSFITKNYINEEQYIQDNNIPKELKLENIYLEVLNINFETGDAIIYNILSDYCFSEKIVPIYYNYNNDININDDDDKINYQEILLYNRNNDKKIYYGIYHISKAKIVFNSLVELLKDEIIKIDKLILLNNAKDLFLIGETNENQKMIYIYYINKFREKKNIDKYEIEKDEFKNSELIVKENFVLIKAKKKLFLFENTSKKEINLPKEQTKVFNPSNNISYIMMNNDRRLAFNKAIEIINIMENGIQNIISVMMGQKNIKMNTKLNDINNYMTDSKNFVKTIFNSERYYIYYFNRKIFFLNQQYFLLITSKHFEFGIIKTIFYLSLYDFKTFEEITKIEIDKFLSNNDNIFDITLKYQDLIIINIKSKENKNLNKTYNYKFKNHELLFIK